MRKKALKIEEREIQVITWFSIRIQHDNNEYATMYEVAGGLGMSPSSRVSLILNGLVDKGSLDKKELPKSGRGISSKRWGYKLKEGTFQRPPPQGRKITIKSAKGISQMELL